MTVHDDCFACGTAPMTVDEALALLARRATVAVPTEVVPIRRALGRVLAQDVVAALSLPPCDNAAMDGYAVFFDDLVPGAETRLPVTARVPAGAVLSHPILRGQAVRIFTGAAMPDGPDTVVMQEHCRVDGDHVVLPPGIQRGANRRPAGGDVTPGTVVLSAGRRLRPQDLGMAAAIGQAELTVYRPLRVALFSTGDELREPGTPLPAGCIHDANRYSVSALLEGLGCAVTDLGILADRVEVVRTALAAAAASHDLIVTSGGVSTGEEDHVRAAVEGQGRLHFWRLAVKPGKPIAMGQVGDVPFLGLPGNPVAAMVTFLVVARPLVLRLSGRTETAVPRHGVRADFTFRKPAGRREFLRARLRTGEDGQPEAVTFPAQGSAILSSMVHSDGLVDLGERIETVQPGDTVTFLLFADLMH
ncbi:MAG: molybdopterin molybdotransferase MoeA [Alphaproteobacteria bacterium]